MNETLTQSAADLSIQMKLGLASVDDAVAWADQWIAELDQAPIELIDLALARNPHPLDFVSQLDTFARGSDQSLALRRGLGEMLRRVSTAQMDFESAIRCLYYRALHEDWPWDVVRFAVWIEDELCRIDDEAYPVTPAQLRTDFLTGLRELVSPEPRAGSPP